MSKDTAKAAWEALKNQYERRSIQNVIYHKRRYRNAVMNEGDDMLAHINRHQEIATQLAAVGAEVQEYEQVWELLLSLPKSYEHLVNALELSQDLTLDAVRQRLVMEDQRREESTMINAEW